MPRTLKAACSLLLAILFSLPFPAAAQGVKPKPPVSSTPTTATPTRTDVKKEAVGKTLTQDQQSALAVLDGLFEAAKRFDDERDWIKTRAQIADVLWAFDEARARRELEAAFRGIEKLKPAPPPAKDDFMAAMATVFGGSPQSQLRSEVLRLIARHDTALARELTKSVVETPPKEELKNTPFGHQSERSTLYLQQALALVETDPVRAAEFAKLSLNGGIGLLFPGVLLALRIKETKLADDLFVDALAVAERDAATAMTNVSLLSPYVFPDYGGAANSMRMMAMLDPKSNIAATQPNPALVTPFLDFAYNMIMRQPETQQSAPDAASSDKESAKAQLESAKAQMMSDYQSTVSYATGQQLLPYFERYAPERAATLRAALENRLRAIPGGTTRDLLANLQQPSTVQELLNKAEDAKTDPEKDSYYQRAAALAAQNGDYDQAISLVEKTHNTELQPLLTSVFRMQAAMTAISKKDWDAAYRYGRDIPDVVQRAAVFAFLAQRLIEKKETVRATQMLIEAELLIGKADNGPEKARAMLLITSAAAHLDTLRGFESFAVAVNAINNSDVPAPEAKGMAAMINGMNNMMMSMLGVQTLDFEQSLPLLARADFNHALYLAQTIRKKETAVAAQLAACRGVLVKTKDDAAPKLSTRPAAPAAKMGGKQKP
ncbi:MAG: hypothetical protein ABR577_11520 [Pyrinomonadaceae bacterium]